MGATVICHLTCEDFKHDYSQAMRAMRSTYKKIETIVGSLQLQLSWYHISVGIRGG